jgi:hypothetical protein
VRYVVLLRTVLFRHAVLGDYRFRLDLLSRYTTC